MAFKPSRGGRVVPQRQQIAAVRLRGLAQSRGIVGSLFDMSGCEATLFLSTVVWRDISCKNPDYRARAAAADVPDSHSVKPYAVFLGGLLHPHQCFL